MDAARERDWVVAGERARAHELASRPSRVRSRSGRRPWGDAHTIPSTPDRLSVYGVVLDGVHDAVLVPCPPLALRVMSERRLHDKVNSIRMRR